MRAFFFENPEQLNSPSSKAFYDDYLAGAPNPSPNYFDDDARFLGFVTDGKDLAPWGEGAGVSAAQKRPEDYDAAITIPVPDAFEILTTAHADQTGTYGLVVEIINRVGRNLENVGIFVVAAESFASQFGRFRDPFGLSPVRVC